MSTGPLFYIFWGLGVSCRETRSDSLRGIGRYRRSSDVNSTDSAGTNLLGRGYIVFPPTPQMPFHLKNILKMAYTNINTTMTVTTMITTTIFSTLVREPSVPPSSAPSAPSISKAVANLAKIPAGLWAVIFLVLAAAIAAGSYFLKKEGKKPEKDDEEEKKEEPKKAKETP